MNFLSVENISKSFGNRTLFKNIGFGLSEGDKVALIARNGTGKTCLFELLAGNDTPDTGEIRFRNGVSVGYLPQNPHFLPDETVMQAVFRTQNPVLNAIRMYESALEVLDVEPENAQAHSDLAEATHIIDQENAWSYEQRIKQILSILKVTDYHKNVHFLSGGQQKRVALAQVLISSPQFLILDEPTNHLDLEMIEWLEEYLSNQSVTLLMVTHDRYFLDRVCQSILELEKDALRTYKGNFSYYITKKAEREIAEASEQEKIKNTYRRELEWVRRMPKARTTKSKARTDEFENIKNSLVRTQTNNVTLSVKTTRLGGNILEFKKVYKRYDEKIILENFSYVFKKGEKIGIIGANGSGKTTFLNLIMQLEPLDMGFVQAGQTVVFGYYSQQGIQLPNDKRVIEVIRDIAEFVVMADGSKLTPTQLLHRFTFSGEQQHQFVSSLSGGEKRRLYLCTILMQNPNFLILDEPTNDLDILTLSVLDEFLQEFNGCMLVVSHDRYFMDKIIDHLFVFEGNGKISDFAGTYTQYRDAEQAKKASQSAPKKPMVTAAAPPAAIAPAPTAPKRSYKVQKQLETLELDIANLETQKTNLIAQLNDTQNQGTQMTKLSIEYEQTSLNLEQKTMQWLELSENH